MTDNDAATVITGEWRDVLGTTEVGADDDFFALGGNSFLAVAFAERVERRLGIEFPMEVLFVDATLGALIEACTGHA